MSTETPKSSDDLEEGVVLRPRFDAAGLITCVTSDAATGEVLMVAHMNEEALQKTVATGEAWYFSRSRKALWRKGETSGHVQRVAEIRIDCDQDAVWLQGRADGRGGLPHRPALLLLSRRGAGRGGRRRAEVRRSRAGVRSGRRLRRRQAQPRLTGR